MDRVIIFVIQQEVHKSDLEDRKDVCIAIGQSNINEKSIVAELHRIGLKVHTSGWCNRGLRGLVISIFSPVMELMPGEYELKVELGDLWPISEKGESSGTVVHRGTYKIKCEGTAKPELISYSQTCCPEEPRPK